MQLAGQTSGNAAGTITGGAMEAAQDENSVMFTRDGIDKAEKIQAEIYRQMAAAK